MDFFDTRYFKISKFLLSFVGLWPYQTFFTKILIFVLVMYSFTVMYVPQLAYLFKHTDSIDSMFEVMPMLTGTSMAVGKGISLTSSSMKFKMLLEHVREDWDNLLTNREMRILAHYAEIGRKFALVYSVGTYIFISCYVMLPLSAPLLDIISPLNETRLKRMPHASEYFVDQDKYYYVLMLNTYISYIVCVMIVVAADSIFMPLVAHICGLYAILCYRLENLMAHDELYGIGDDCVHRRNEINRRMRSCIQLHERIRVLIDIVTSTFATCFLVDVVLGFILHTSIIVRMGQSSEIVRYVVIAIIQNCRLFVNNWAGQEVADHSSGISTAAYNGMWYNAPPEVQKSLILLIARSQKACCLTVAKLYVINLEAFNLVMKTSVSYCTVMISLRDTSGRT